MRGEFGYDFSMSEQPSVPVLDGAHAILLMEQIQKIGRVGGWEFDFETGTLYWTDELWRLHGLEPGSVPLTGDLSMSYFSAEDRARIGEIVLTGIRTGQPYWFETELHTSKGGRRVIAAGNSLQEEGRAPRIYGAMLDITDRWEMEQALRQGEAMQVLNDRMLALGRFVANVVHEMNAPLAVMSLNLELLERELQQRQVVAPALPVLERALQQLVDLVADLRRFSQGEAREQGPVDVQGVLGWVQRMVRLAARERRIGFELRVEGAPAVWATEQRLMQLYMNLVTNAFDALPSHGGAVRVWLRVEGDRALVDVQDNGPGVPPALRERIFEPFFTTKGDHGTGLGLAICRNIAERGGGSLELLSPPEGGACFRVSLPVYAASPPGSPPPAPPG